MLLREMELYSISCMKLGIHILFNKRNNIRCLQRQCKRIIHTAVVPELVRAVTQIKVAFMSHYPQYFAVIAHNTEKHCDFCSALPSKKSHNTTGRYLPLVWELLIYSSISTLYEHSDYKNIYPVTQHENPSIISEHSRLFVRITLVIIDSIINRGSLRHCFTNSKGRRFQFKTRRKHHLLCPASRH